MPDTFALHYIPESFSIAGQKLMGRQSAGVGLLGAMARGAGLREVGCLAADRSHADAFAATLREEGFGGVVAWIPPSAPQELDRFGCLYHPGPGIERLAWRRLAAGEHRYSLCGITHATASHEMMSMVANLLVAPVRSWDAIVCTSRAVRDSLRVLVEEQADYLRTRLAAQRFELPQLPLIPLGVHCAALAPDPARRTEARARLGIGTDDVACTWDGCRCTPSRTRSRCSAPWSGRRRAGGACTWSSPAGTEARRSNRPSAKRPRSCVRRCAWSNSTAACPPTSSTPGPPPTCSPRWPTTCRRPSA
jgi:hypothetical protein